MAIDHETLLGMLTRLKLTAIRDQLDNLLDEAARRELTLREALGFLIEREVARKDERRIEMAMQKFTHAAMATARLCIANALDAANRRARELVIPHCTYTDPEVAQVGLTPRQAREEGIPY